VLTKEGASTDLFLVRGRLLRKLFFLLPLFTWLFFLYLGESFLSFYIGVSRSLITRLTPGEDCRSCHAHQLLDPPMSTAFIDCLVNDFLEFSIVPTDLEVLLLVELVILEHPL